jgi:hypothetical protein
MLVDGDGVVVCGTFGVTRKYVLHSPYVTFVKRNISHCMHER